MTVGKNLTVRDYLEPRYAAAAGSRVAGAARKGLYSFKQVLKNETLKPAKDVAEGMRVSEYLKNPLLRTQAARLSRAAAGAGAGPRSTEVNAEADRPALIGRDRTGARSPHSALDQLRAENVPGHPVEKSVQQAAAKYNLSPELIRGVIRAESNYKVDAVSSAGAKGLMQLMPETAKELGVSNPFDIRQNVDGGARYLRQMLDRFGGDLRLALAAYNAGPGAVEQFNGDVPFAETRQYVQRVLRYAGLKA